MPLYNGKLGRATHFQHSVGQSQIFCQVGYNTVAFRIWGGEMAQKKLAEMLDEKLIKGKIIDRKFATDLSIGP